MLVPIRYFGLIPQLHRIGITPAGKNSPDLTFPYFDSVVSGDSVFTHLFIEDILLTSSSVGQKFNPGGNDKSR